MSMVESGLGVSILPQLILKRVPYDIAIKELDVPAHRDIALAMRCKKTAPLAVRKFIEYLKYRKG
jgi:DNA-binding transcriptional LysR family regulator